MRIDDLLEHGDGLIRVGDHPSRQSTIQRAARAGLVVPVLPGVYAHPARATSVSLRLRAACLWSASGVLHGRTAAELHLRRPISLPILMVAPYRGRRLPAWLQVSVGEVASPLVGSGIRVAGTAHCAVELAADDSGETIFEMLRRGMVTTSRLAEVAPEFAGTVGNPRRAVVVAASLDNPWSFGELKLHDLLRQAGITGWVANRGVRVRGRVVFPDVHLPAHRLVIEFDGEAVHSTHEQFEDDRRRQNLLVLGGYRVLRFTWEAVTCHPEEVVATIRSALRQPR